MNKPEGNPKVNGAVSDNGQETYTRSGILRKPRTQSVTALRKNEPRPKKTKRSSEAFIAIHLGAGDHNLTVNKRDLYKSLCKTSCQEGMKVLLSGGSADEAVAVATIFLENSKLVNAGQGSSLTIDQTVECDAGFMNGSGYFGGVAAVPGVPNPILIAKKIADLHREEPLLSCGRIPPTCLSGLGAKSWAESNGIPTCDENLMVSDRNRKVYKKYIEKMQKAEESMSSEVSDTVGAIALDKFGNVASTVSSGGNWLKHSGRVGHAPVFGCGCFSHNNTKDKNAIAVSCSGSGEMLAKSHLPQCISKCVESKACLGLVDAVSTVIQKEFISNELLKCHKETKNVGMIGIRWDGRRGEYVWGHTSKSFIVAHLASSNEVVKVEFSELQENAIPGKSMKVNGVAF